MSTSLGRNNGQLAQTFTEWNKSELDSYLIEITSHIFKFKESDGGYLVDKILDAAGQKGTGKWAVPLGPRPRPPRPPHRRSGLPPPHLLAQGGTGRGLHGPGRTDRRQV